jgi:hypothetical protein
MIDSNDVLDTKPHNGEIVCRITEHDIHQVTGKSQVNIATNGSLQKTVALFFQQTYSGNVFHSLLLRRKSVMNRSSLTHAYN